MYGSPFLMLIEMAIPRPAIPAAVPISCRREWDFSPRFQGRRREMTPRGKRPTKVPIKIPAWARTSMSVFEDDEDSVDPLLDVPVGLEEDEFGDAEPVLEFLAAMVMSTLK